MASKSLSVAGLALLFLSITLPGCGSSGVIAGPEATGTVTLDGSPITRGRMEFYPTGGGSSALAAIQSDGTFRVKTSASATGIAPGEYVVIVESWEALGEEDAGEPRSLIPKKYADGKTSDLRITVTEEGPNDFHLELKSEPAKTSDKSGQPKKKRSDEG